MNFKQIFGAGILAGLAGSFLASASNGATSTGALSASGKSQPLGQQSSQSVDSNVKVNATVTPAIPTNSKAVSQGAVSVSTATNSVLGNSIFVNYGNVQVKVTARGKKITDVKAVQYPHQDGQSLMIARYSVPILRQQALKAQSAHIAGVSGASYTSYGFQKSLQSALKKLGL